ncbi:Autotransporter beta-domain superfamily protein [Candidatus Erwinia haradaeae]|uniref:Autotransporter beta-domain superfamily protein n=1 Tax=Candidatus Erwinia haradaeae TaxID=1922217 RepID=A0A451DPC5_9GAMM|nr:Autotransporter beta-domain superfamily protein [Candidatus Erwinia haradaeae]
MKFSNMIISVCCKYIHYIFYVLFFFSTISLVFAVTIPILPKEESVDDALKTQLASHADPESHVVYAISSNGEVAGGYSSIQEYQRQASVWSGLSWAHPTKLGTLKSDNTGMASILALSTDGKIAGGYSTPVNTDSRHAVIWSGDNWKIATDIDSQRSNHAIVSEVSSLSADGKIAGGHSSANDKDLLTGAIWSGDHWGTYTNVGMDIEHAKYPIYSGVSVLSGDGKVAGGYMSRNRHASHAIIWSGANWGKKTIVDGSSSDSIFDKLFNNSVSEVLALSFDGKVAGGFRINEKNIPQATVWLGDNWVKQVHLGTLSSSASGESKVLSLSPDGLIAGGYSSINGNGSVCHAIIWSGKDWKNKIDLGTLKNDLSGSSEIFSFSPNGKIAFGESDADDIVKHPFLFRVPREASDLLQLDSVSSKRLIEDKNMHMMKPFLVDAINTRSAINQVSTDAFTLIKSQEHTLTNLQQGCVAGNNRLCWLIYTKPAAFMAKNVIPVVNLGYGVTERFSLGGVITRPLSNYFPNSYKMNGNNLGLGLYADWHAFKRFGEFYFRPAVSFSQYEADIERFALPHTEYGQGNSTLNGFSSSLEWGGGNPILGQSVLFFWHTGLRYNHFSRNAYQEDNMITLPVSYNKINHGNARGDLGADIRVSIVRHLIWLCGIKIEHILKENDLISNSSIYETSRLSIRNISPKTSTILKNGMVYTLSNNISVSVFESIIPSTSGHENWKFSCSLTGTF